MGGGGIALPPRDDSVKVRVGHRYSNIYGHIISGA